MYTRHDLVFQQTTARAKKELMMFFYDQTLSHCELEITPISGQYNYTETFDHDALIAIIHNIKHIKN